MCIFLKGVVVSNLSASDFKGKRSLPLLTSPGTCSYVIVECIMHHPVLMLFCNICMCVVMLPVGATVHDLLCHQVHAVDQQPKLRSPAALSSSCSLHEAASFMLLHHMHRVWVVPATATDSDSLDSSSVSSNVLLEGLKVLTITDILRAVYDSESSLR